MNKYYLLICVTLVSSCAYAQPVPDNIKALAQQRIDYLNKQIELQNAQLVADPSALQAAIDREKLELTQWQQYLTK